jgi:hypothetical protein
MAGAAKSRKVALGFRTHSGWASAILAAGRGSAIEILDRRHVALCDSASEGAKQPFHAAEPMPFAQAESHIALCREATAVLARDAIKTAGMTCERWGARLSGVCIITASGRALPDLRAILASHALIHAAEGEFYRDALVGAAEAMGVKASRLKETEALSHVGLRMDIGEAAMTKKLVEIGKTVGRPWTSDEKLATLAAWSLLAG